MCGRYTITVSIKKLAERFGFKVLSEEFSPRYNIAPGQSTPVVIRRESNSLEIMQWGLVPHWAKDEKIGHKMINARSETVDIKPSFKKPFPSEELEAYPVSKIVNSPENDSVECIKKKASEDDSN